MSCQLVVKVRETAREQPAAAAGLWQVCQQAGLLAAPAFSAGRTASSHVGLEATPNVAWRVVVAHHEAANAGALGKPAAQLGGCLQEQAAGYHLMGVIEL